MNKYVLGFALTALMAQQSNAAVPKSATVKKDIAVALYTAALIIEDQRVRNDLWNIISCYIESNQSDCSFEKIAEEFTEALGDSLIEAFEDRAQVEAFIGTVSDRIAAIDDVTFLADIASFAECTLKNGGTVASCGASTKLFQ